MAVHSNFTYSVYDNNSNYTYLFIYAMRDGINIVQLLRNRERAFESRKFCCWMLTVLFFNFDGQLFSNIGPTSIVEHWRQNVRIMFSIITIIIESINKSLNVDASVYLLHIILGQIVKFVYYMHMSIYAKHFIFGISMRQESKIYYIYKGMHLLPLTR